MTNKIWMGLVSALALSASSLTLGAGCIEYVEEDKDAPAFAPESGQTEIPGQAEYAPGPYGFTKGKIFPNFTAVGFANFMADPNLAYVSMGDFYNPTGSDVYPEGSPYGAGQPKPKALLMVMSAAWCGPCKQEASTVLPAEFAKFQPMGGHFFALLVEAVNGDPADYGTITNWASQFDVNYTIAADTTEQAWGVMVSSILEEGDQPGFPGNMIVRTSDMKIIEVVSGAPPPGHPFWGLYESLLDGSYTGTL